MICFGIVVIDRDNNKFHFLVANDLGSCYAILRVIDLSKNLYVGNRLKFDDLDQAKLWLDSMSK